MLLDNRPGLCQNSLMSITLHVHTQYMENYGDAAQPYWKFKGGDTYVVTGFSHPLTDGIGRAAEVAVESVRASIERSDEFAQIYILDWELVLDGRPTEDERLQQEYDGRVSSPSPRVALPVAAEWPRRSPCPARKTRRARGRAAQPRSPTTARWGRSTTRTAFSLLRPKQRLTPSARPGRGTTTEDIKCGVRAICGRRFHISGLPARGRTTLTVWGSGRSNTTTGNSSPVLRAINCRACGALHPAEVPHRSLP